MLSSTLQPNLTVQPWIRRARTVHAVGVHVDVAVGEVAGESVGASACRVSEWLATAQVVLFAPAVLARARIPAAVCPPTGRAPYPVWPLCDVKCCELERIEATRWASWGVTKRRVVTRASISGALARVVVGGHVGHDRNASLGFEDAVRDCLSKTIALHCP